MSKKTARRAAASSTSAATLTAESPRRPCPCGSGRRYKSCHGGSDPADLIVSRPFEGLAAETELIALREFVPSATAPLTLKAGGPEAGAPVDVDAPADAGAAPATPSITLATVLPGAAAALTRSDGSILLGLQVQTHSGDLSRDLAAALEWALAAEPSSVLAVVGRATLGPRWDDLVVDEPLQVTVHDDFAWWLETDPQPGTEVAASLERANGAVMPSAKIADLPGAYWVDTGDKAHLRWVRPEDEQTLMAALARLAAAGELDLGEGTRYVGSFRAHGCLVPVWDLDRDAHPSEWTEPVLAFAARLDAALAAGASGEPLTDAQRRARDGILGRQFTLR